MPTSPGPWISEGRRIYGAPDPRSNHLNGRPLLFQAASETHGVDSPWNASLEEARALAKQGIDPVCEADVALATAAPELAKRLLHRAERWHDQFCDAPKFAECSDCAQDVALLKRAGVL